MSEAANPLTSPEIREADGAFVIAAYDPVRWPFAEAMCDLLGVTSFDELPVGDPADPAGAMNVNRGFRRELASAPLDGPFFDLYRSLVSGWLAPLFGPWISHTERPVLRVQIAHSPSISAPHRDVDYTARWDYLNAWLPMIDVPAETAIRVESSYASGVMRPHPVRQGEVLLFDGGALKHHSPANTTSRPRVSMDFRFTPRQPSRLMRRLLSARPPEVERIHASRAPGEARDRRVVAEDRQA